MAEPVEPGEAHARARDAGGADVILELVGSPNLAADLESLAMKGRLIVVGTGAGDEGPLALRTLMSRRARILGTMLRARPLEEKAAAVQAFGRQIVPALADGRLHGFVDRVFPVAQVEDAFAYIAEPGKFGKVLLEF